MLVDEFLVVGDDALGDGLADGVDLRGVATARDAHADVDGCELVETDDQERLVHFEAEDFGLHEVEGGAVDFDEAATSLRGRLAEGGGREGGKGCTLQWATAVAGRERESALCSATWNHVPPRKKITIHNRVRTGLLLAEALHRLSRGSHLGFIDYPGGSV